MERDEFTSKHSFLEGYTVESVEMVDGKENKNGQQCVILKKGDSQYKMMVTLKRGKKEDRAVILRENNTLFMELNYVNDEANGELLVYDEMGILVERGYLKNGDTVPSKRSIKMVRLQKRFAIETVYPLVH